MKKSALILFFAASSLAAMAQSTNWAVDNTHTNVKFTVTHMVVSEVDGNFKSYDGKITSKSPTDFNDATVEFSVDVNSINTDNEDRDKHLLADDFFNAEKFPKMTFKSTSFKKVNDKSYKLTGNLTIRDVTKTVTFDVMYGGIAKDPWGNTKAGFKATSTINRKDYGLKWSVVTEAGGMVVGDDVKITINLELNQAK